jgi:hypothetical protein
VELGTAQVCAVLANIHRTEQAKTFLPGDFIPTRRENEHEEVQEADIDWNARSVEIARTLGKKD